MQMNRCFEIVYLLLERKKITAQELADRFEVSVRTIYRDLDFLSQAGIPIYARRGKDGGIELWDTFVLNKTVFSEAEKAGTDGAAGGLAVHRCSGRNAGAAKSFRAAGPAASVLD